MGYMVELNTLLGLPKGFNVSKLKIGKKYSVEKERERAFPLHVAILTVDAEWNFYGYSVVHKAVIENGITILHFEILTLFSEYERKLYKQKFLEAAQKSGELS